MTLRVAIVGAGLGGLAAARFLRKADIDVTVYEQARELHEVGAGIVVPPNMVRPLHKLGLAAELSQFAVRLEAAWEFRRWSDGAVLFVQPMGSLATSLIAPTWGTCCVERCPSACFSSIGAASPWRRPMTKFN
jgi:2-polyprenyl-6-methoxyphenol hydroxylase-like FAD-dependent oxidoreductase